MLIDCSTCVARNIACTDCVVTVLLGSPPVHTSGAQVHLDDAERDALGQLASAGLVPPLRLVRSVSSSERPGGELSESA